MSDEAKRIVAEETWGISRRIADGSYEVSCETDNGIPVAIGYTEEEARIAACAPEALRMLLARGCPDEWHAKVVGTGCPDSCPWLALMRKAGLR